MCILCTCVCGVCMYMCVHMCVSVVRVYVYVYTCVCVHACVLFVSMCVCACTYYTDNNVILRHYRKMVSTSAGATL